MIKIDKERDLIRYAEIFLLGVIIFFGRYFRTSYDYLFRSKIFDADVGLFNKDVGQLDPRSENYLRPLTFLFTNYLIIAMIFPVIFNISIPGALGEGPLSSFGTFLSSITKTAANLKTTEALILIAPFILATGMFSWIQSKMSYLFSASRISTGRLLLINSFGLGAFLFSIFLTMCIAIRVLTFLEPDTDGLLRNIALLAMTPILIIYIRSIFRYVDIISIILNRNWVVSILFIISVYMVFQIVFSTILILIPITEIFLSGPSVKVR